ncbi:MAG: hypothetical protein HHJ13_14380 [Phycicoccus sp.]|nr:hypothetical protein [Phycicoccus sp.]
MTLTRIYIPLNAAGLRRLDADRAITKAPFLAYAVTDAVCASAPVAGQDQWEYSALGDAVLRSAALLGHGERRRLVAAADVEPELVGPVVPSDSGDFIEDSAVLILDSVALNRIASFQVDADEAAEDDELLWYDVTELPVILALL